MNERSAIAFRASRNADLLNGDQLLLANQAKLAGLGAVGMALLLSTTAALDTGSLPFIGRTVYWLVEMILGGTIIGFVLWVIQRIPNDRIFLKAALVFVVATPFVTLMAWATTEMVKGNHLQLRDLVVYLPGAATVTGFNAFIQVLYGRKHVEESQVRSKHAETNEGDRLYAIEAQGHYVVFHTSGGPKRKLMRFRDAVMGAQAYAPGLMVHRSWWVVQAAVSEIYTPAVSMELKNGLKVPISRARVKRVTALMKLSLKTGS